MRRAWLRRVRRWPCSRDLGTLWEHQGFEVESDWLGPAAMSTLLPTGHDIAGLSRKCCMYSCSWSFVTPVGSERQLRFAHMTTSHGGRRSTLIYNQLF